MAAGTEVSKLYLSLGLNIDDLAGGFNAAKNSINAEIQKLNAEAKTIKLKASFDAAKLGEAGNDVDKLKIKEQSLTQQIEIQKRKVDILAQAYKAANEQFGGKSKVTYRAQNNYLQQATQLEKLKTALTMVQVEQNKVNQSGISKMANGASSGLDKLTGSFGLLSGKLAAFMAIATTGAGLFNITQDAMQAGENLYKLSNRLHLTTGEAASLNRVFSISGVNIQAVIPFFSNLDKQVLSSNKGLNSTSLALLSFGINLKDSAGNLLPLNRQLDELAAGYQRAAEAGKLEEFQAQILGRRGAELIPLLEDYKTNMQIANNVKTTGLLDPVEAHKLSIEWRTMNAEAGQLKTAFGAAMIPIAQAIMPEVTEGMKTFVSIIKDNKDDVKDSIEGWATAIEAVAKVIGVIGLKSGQVLKELEYSWNNKGKLNTIAMMSNPISAYLGGSLIKKDYDAYRMQQGVYDDIQKGKDYSSIGNVFQKALHKGIDAPSTEGFTKYANIINKNTPFIEEAWNRVVNSSMKAENADKKNAETANKNASAQLKAADAMKWRASAAGQLAETIYTLTHNDIDSVTHAMYVEAEKAKANGVPDDLINNFINAKSTRIAEDKFRNVTAPMAQAFKTDLQNQLDDVDLQAKDYIQRGASSDEANKWAQARKSKIRSDWDAQVAGQIDSIWENNYQKRLSEINREKQAWIQKGLDEVKATKWAEESKKQLQQQSAQEMFTSQKKYFEIFRNAMAGGSDINGAAQQIAEQMRKDKGIANMSFTSPAEIAQFQQAMQIANNNLVPILSDATYRGVKAAMVEVVGGTQSSYQLPGDVLAGINTEAVDAFKMAGMITGEAAVSVIQGTQTDYYNYSQPSGTANWQDYPLWTQQQANAMFSSDDITRVTDSLNKIVDTLENTSSKLNYNPSARQINNYPEATKKIQMHILVSGLEDAENKVAEAGAEIVAKALGDAEVGLSY